MKERSFFTTLIMYVIGWVFIIAAIGIMIYCLMLTAGKSYIRKKGIQIEATVVAEYKKYISAGGFDEYPYGYKIRYTVQDKGYTYYFSTDNNYYDENEIINVYCLPNHPEEASVESEKFSRYI